MFSIFTALRCIGDSKTPMKLMFLSSILNIVLDPLHIFERVPGLNIPGLGLGIFGAALATVISITTTFIIGIIILFNVKRRIRPTVKGLFKLNWTIDKKLITIGLPTGIEVLFRNSANFLLLKIITIYGTSAVAVMGIGQRLSGFVIMPLIGLLMGSSTIVGQNLGADQTERAEKTTHYAAAFGGIIMVFITALAWLFPSQIMSIFVKDKEVIALGIDMLRVVIPSYIFLGIAFGWGSGFSGAGYNLPFLICALVSRWAVQLPFLFLTVYIFELPVIFIWISFFLSEFTEFVVTAVIYFRGRWKTRRVSHLV